MFRSGIPLLLANEEMLNYGSPQHVQSMGLTNMYPPMLKQMKKLKRLGNKKALNDLMQYSLYTGEDMNSALDKTIDAELAMDLSGFKLKRKSNRKRKSKKSRKQRKSRKSKKSRKQRKSRKSKRSQKGGKKKI